MIGKLTHKTRLILLFVGTVLLFIIAYNFSISETIKVYKEYAEINSKLTQIASAPQQIKELEEKSTELDGIIGNASGTTVDFQKKLLDRISQYCQNHSLTLLDFPQVHKYINQEYEFITCYARVEGSFIPLLKLLLLIENNPDLGKVSSVDFSSFIDRKTKEHRLTLSIYIQSLKQLNDEPAKE
jgi:CHASE3 domain sensor protein